LQGVIALVVCLLCLWLRLTARDWAIIVLMVVVVFTAEFLNTAIEAAVDLASPRKHPLAGVAKDVSAAAVLITALGAVVVGLLILGPPLVARMNLLLGSR
jgi:diacylglycerol kinase